MLESKKHHSETFVSEEKKRKKKKKPTYQHRQHMNGMVQLYHPALQRLLKGPTHTQTTSTSLHSAYFLSFIFFII